MKSLPEPAISCYGTDQLTTMVAEACDELQKRGWIATWNIVAPKSKSVAKRVAIQQGHEQPGTTEQADSDLKIAVDLGNYGDGWRTDSGQ